MDGPYQKIFADAGIIGDPEQIEEQVRLQVGGTLDSLTREELIEEGEAASEILRGLA